LIPEYGPTYEVEKRREKRILFKIQDSKERKEALYTGSGLSTEFTSSLKKTPTPRGKKRGIRRIS